MAKTLPASPVRELAMRICEALGLNPSLVSCVSFSLPASDFGPVIVHVELIGSAELLDIDWEKELENAKVEVTIIRDEE